jgi:hypothetical protein
LHHRATNWKWCGPALIAFGLIALAVLLVPGATRGNLLAEWIAQEMLAPARILPLIGVGIALVVARGPTRLATAALGVAGIAIGFWLYKALLDPLWIIPRAVESRFLTAPVLDLATGLALVVGGRWRAWLLSPLMFLAGAALALGIVVTDPSIQGSIFAITGLVISLWILASAALCARNVHTSWLEIGGRIFGAWLIAIGLLYGGWAFVQRPDGANDAPSERAVEGAAVDQQILPGDVAGVRGA